MNEDLSVPSDLELRQTNILVHVSIPIAKSGVDAERRTVRGIATQEIIDVHGEEVDFGAFVECLAAWRGNIREMHQPKAVGKAVDIVVLEDLKAVEVEAYISKGAEDTWQKCLEGVLGFYSIGGVADRVIGTRSDGTQGPRLLMKRLNELSLVDSGACPTATIAVVKMLDGQPTAALPGDDSATREERGERDERGEEASASTATKTAADTAGVQTPVRKFISETWDIQRALAIIGSLADLIQSESWDLRPDGTDPRDSAGQMALLRLAVEIVLDFIATEFASQFEDETVVANLADDQRAVLSAVVEKVGARHSRRDTEMLQSMHDQAVKLGASCGDRPMEKTIETPATSAETLAAAADPDPQPAEKSVESSAEVHAPAPAAATDAPAAAADPVVVEKVVAPLAQAEQETTATLDLSALVTEAVQKATSQLSTQLTELQATSTATIAQLQEQIAKLEAQPEQTGPVANAHAAVVKKAFAGQTGQPLSADEAQLAIAVLKEVAQTSTDPSTRQAIATKMLELQLAHGLDARLVPIPSQR